MAIQKSHDKTKNVMKTPYQLIITSSIFFLVTLSYGQEAVFLKRSLDHVTAVSMDLSSESAHYQPFFGVGDSNSQIVKCVKRYGHLTIDPDGKSQSVVYNNEEQVGYVLEGTGILYYKDQYIPISKHDFFYMPAGMEHSYANPRESALKVMIMGYELPKETLNKVTSNLKIANADGVSFQVLGQHGPTTQFQLLLGTTESKRDRLAAACQVNSLFVMDFAKGGTNIPHKHEKEEEIYFLLRGHGEMVAGETPSGEEKRYKVKEGDAFFIPNNTLVGFYSGTKEGEEHARIMAVRSKLCPLK